MEEKICFRCKFKIFEKEHYFVFIEYDEAKKITTSYAHKKCWDEIKQTININKQASGMLHGMNKFLIKQGIFPEKEEEWHIA